MKNQFQDKTSYLADEDVQLMLRCKSGDQIAFEKLLLKYFKPLLNFIYRLIGNREESEELTQEVFIRIYKSAGGYQAKAKFRTWAYTIAKNVALNHLRDREPPAISLDRSLGEDERPESLQVAETTGARPDQEVLRNERMGMILGAINDLPENQRVAVVLCRFEGFSYEEIARAMNTSPASVKSLLNRARENLKKNFEKFIR